MDSLREITGQLDRYADQLRGSNPQLYRDLALYLQTLRDGLLNSVQQACFHLATRYYPDRYCALTQEQRKELRRRLADRVRRASSLLTVEQLVLLAGQLALDQEQQHLSRRREWLAQLQKSREDAGHAEGVEGADAPLVMPLDPAQADAEPLDRGVPSGSVHLDGTLPPGLARLFEPVGEFESDPEPGEAEGDPPLADAWIHAVQLRSGPVMSDGAAAGEDTGELPDSLLEQEQEQEQESAGTSPVPAPWHEPTLPLDPVALLRWLDGFDAALSRRLRHLSHALNVELLHGGLTSILLPPALLEAAVLGQLEPQPAPANLLRLHIPVVMPGSGAALESVVVLLRPADLELEAPRLRTCRSRWQRHREETRRMAEHYRRLKRRLQTLEAERLWHQDTPSPSQTPERS